MSAQPNLKVIEMINQELGGTSMPKPATAIVNTPVVKTAPVAKTVKKRATAKPSIAKKQVTKPINESIVKIETPQLIARKPEPVVPQMSASELIVNFGKGAANAYSQSLTESFKPLAFLVNNGVMIAKGFSHLAMPLLMTYLLVTQIAFIQTMIAQSGNQAIGLVYSVSFYFASALVWFTSWVAIIGLGKSIKSACYKMALKGRTL